MLASLYVKDFAIVEEIEVSLGPGMTAVSGETGAGKSLLVDALMQLTGTRADAGMVRHGAARAELAARFELQDPAAALAWLREQMLEDGSQCQLRRVIAAEGGSRAWINGRPATIGQLAELGRLLVGIHGQHEHQLLLERGHQLELLDAFGAHAGELQRVRSLAGDWRALERELQQLTGGEDAAARIDWLRHQLAELDAEALDPASIAELEAEHRRHANAATLIAGCERALAVLGSDEAPAPVAVLSALRIELSGLVADEPRLAEALDLLESARIQLDEAAASVERVRDGLDLDPQSLAELEARLTRLHDLARKHRVRLEELADKRAALAGELDALGSAGERIAALRTQSARVQRQWQDAAAALGRAREIAAANLGSAVTSLMAELGMGGGRFEPAIEHLDPRQPDPNGAERVEFLVAANPGAPPRPLRKVASGGELSRIALAIEVAALGLDEVPSMVFDEVDAGIGGAVAEVVGQKLRALGERRQVLCVTHLPQVAAQGHGHLCVRKSTDGGATRNRIDALDGRARVEELARMLGGIEITSRTRAHARQMLESAQAP
ncbi:MAG TPA: DNA repair protein RecN [Xanthomonadaceae bacterium]|nr:DNA repair protein RecN [Xanthomonadaceae bacterium]